MKLILDDEEIKVVKALKEEGISDILSIAFLADREAVKIVPSKKFVSNLKKGKIEFKLGKGDIEFIGDMLDVNISAPLIAALLLQRNEEQLHDKGLTKMKMFIPFKNEEEEAKLVKAFDLEDEGVKEEHK